MFKNLIFLMELNKSTFFAIGDLLVRYNFLYIIFIKTTGSPLSGAKRLQLNMDMVPVPEVECMKNLPEMLMPMIWLEESIHLNKTWTNLLKYQLFL